MDDCIIDLHTTVAQLLDTHPELIPVFVHFRTDCVGCPMAPFCTLKDTIQHYQLNASRFLQDLDQALAGPEREADSR